MLFRRRSKDPVGTAGLPQPVSSGSDVRSCPSLAKALKHLTTIEKPRILDLGPLCGATAVFLAGRGARVSVEEFDAPPCLPKRESKDDPVPDIEPFRIEQPSDSFDLVLAWEALDFTPPERLEEVVAEIRRLVREKGYIFVLSRNFTGSREAVEDVPGRFRVGAEDRIIRESAGTRTKPRWVHLTREIERVLKPFLVQGIHLQRDQTREILAMRKVTVSR